MRIQIYKQGMLPKDVSIFFFEHNLIFILGQQSAMALGDALSEERDMDAIDGGDL